MDGAQAIKKKINFIKLRGTIQDANGFKKYFLHNLMFKQFIFITL